MLRNGADPRDGDLSMPSQHDLAPSPGDGSGAAEDAVQHESLFSVTFTPRRDALVRAGRTERRSGVFLDSSRLIISYVQRLHSTATSSYAIKRGCAAGGGGSSLVHARFFK